MTVVQGGCFPPAPTDFQEAKGCFLLDREKSGRVSVDVSFPGGQDINAQALPGKSLVVGEPFRANSWREVERITEVGGLTLSFFPCALDFTMSPTSCPPRLFP